MKGTETSRGLKRCGKTSERLCQIIDNQIIILDGLCLN